jgi:hypothetical protein
MDWFNELYVKLYRRRTDDDLLLSWEARALWHEMLKLFDRSGLITTRRGALGLAVLTGIPHEVVERALPELLEDGRVRVTDGGWIAPNFIAAQEATKSHALRQKEYRERIRTKALSQSGDTSLSVSDTNGHARDGTRQRVTPSDSDLIRSEQNRSELRRACARDLLFPAEYERRRVPEDPSLFMVIDKNGDYHGLVRLREDGSEERAE